MSLHDTDYIAWTEDVATKLRSGRRLDREDENIIAEVIEDVGKAERRSLRSAVRQLYMHLLKLNYQPQMTSNSWRVSVRNQQREIRDIIEDNPGLKPLLSDPLVINAEYEAAVDLAVIDTDLPEETFPAECPFTYEDFGLPRAHRG